MPTAEKHDGIAIGDCTAEVDAPCPVPYELYSMTHDERRSAPSRHWTQMPEGLTPGPMTNV
jgi:hypothetical protein